MTHLISYTRLQRVIAFNQVSVDVSGLFALACIPVFVRSSVVRIVKRITHYVYNIYSKAAFDYSMCVTSIMRSAMPLKSFVHIIRVHKFTIYICERTHHIRITAHVQARLERKPNKRFHC